MTNITLGTCEAVTCSRAVDATGEPCVAVRISLSDAVPSRGKEGLSARSHVDVFIPARLAWTIGTTIAALSIPQPRARRLANAR